MTPARRAPRNEPGLSFIPVFFPSCRPGAEPDIGMPEAEAQRFFQQLIAGVVSAARVVRGAMVVGAGGNSGGAGGWC